MWFRDSVSFVSLPQCFAAPHLGGVGKTRLSLTVLSEFQEPSLPPSIELMPENREVVTSPHGEFLRPFSLHPQISKIGAVVNTCERS